MPNATELPIDATATELEMANEIFGGGVIVNAAQYFGDAQSSGIYTNGDAISPDATPGDSGVILSTGHVADFTNSDGTTNTNTSTNTGTNTNGIDRDSDFDAIAGRASYDAAFMEIDFTPDGDFITIDFVIASEEYPEFISSNYLDVVGVWVNGVEAEVSIGDGSASVGNINGAETPNLYNDNTSDAYNTEMDGFTITLTFVAPVNNGVPNTLKIGVADVQDSGYDTNLLIAGGSVQSTVVLQDDEITFGHNDEKTLDVLANDSSSAGTLSVTHINGTPVSAGDTVVLPTGQEITLNPDGTFQILGDDDAETVYFTYTAEDTSGNAASGLVEIVQVPCFTAGCRVDTPDGPMLVEDIRPGQIVLTRDNGPMPVRWAGTSRVKAEGKHRPVRIAAGSFGAQRDITVSPNHRILVCDIWAELLFGAPEVLVKAKDLVNHRTVCWADDLAEVTYVHLLLDSHQTLFSDGLISESYQPGQQTLDAFDAETQAEIFALFPALATDPDGYGAANRPTLRSRDVAPLRAALAG
ncbi:Hint domain-containing protein [Aliishimia ponticola]|uniref:Hint domain-containing protein n=1 Tax=Aliishimia ponticola TaxID=2499833 RepID=A0A4S4NFI4_9RHOB|nr:Hint domain-containing protein [Aliishimia ponticola]THH38344.1 Hint domain-containing protein [Aliishimia ponticola]